MKKSESIKNIATAMARVQSQLKPIEKNVSNPITKSKYTPLDKIVEYLLPIISAEGLSFTQFPVADGSKVGVETLLMHTSGEWIEFEPFMMEIAENKRMTGAQEAGSIVTYAKRYSISAIFGLVSDEDKDGNSSKPNEPMTIEKAKAFKMTFGKHKGRTLSELADDEPGYLNWLYTAEKTSPEIKEAIKLLGQERKRASINESMDTMLEDPKQELMDAYSAEVMND